jgi:L,D-transpeptidase catalytic domain
VAGIGAAVVTLGDSGEPTRSGQANPPPFAPSSGQAAGEAPAGPGFHPVARVSAPTTLRDRPHGRPLARVDTRTEYGSPRVLGVVDRRDGWLQVIASELPNVRRGWIPADRARTSGVPYSLRADLSRREVTVLREGRAVRRVTVAVGQPRTPTPTGRFAVTDKLEVSDPRSPYGCCALALSGHQPNIRQGWSGGDRLAIHATRSITTIGHAASLGCLRAHTSAMRWLVDTIPLGTPVFIRA